MNDFVSVTKFAVLILYAGIRDVKSLLVTLGFPVFMLLAFWVTTRDGSEESGEMLARMIPAICAIAVMMAGQTQMSMLVKWKETGILKRLSLTVVPLGFTIAGISIALAVIGVFQGLILIVLSLVLSGIFFSFTSFINVILFMFLIGLTFIAIGTAMASVISRSWITGFAFFSIFTPLFFLGSIPLEALPEKLALVVPRLPTTIGINLIRSLFSDATISLNIAVDIAGLLIYAVFFFVIGGVILSRKNQTFFSSHRNRVD